MKILADEWPKALLNCVLLSAIFLYMSLPFWGFETWHRVLPEHDHVLVSADHFHPTGTVDDTTLSTRQNALTSCVDCNSAQPSITVMHLPNAVGLLSFFALVIGAVSPFTLTIPPALIERVPQVILRVPSFVWTPVDPPPNPIN